MAEITRTKDAKKTNSNRRSPWFWIPTLYFAEGIPYVLVMLVSVVLYKRMGISNADIALYTSWLYLPWVIKPLWSPLVDILRTKRFWIITMQLLIGAGLGGVALSIPLPNFFKVTLGFFWLLAFSSATHDIAADGFYMLGLSQHKQAWFVGIRSTFYRVAMITGQGLLIIFAGFIESHSGLPSVDTTVIANPQSVSQTTIPSVVPDTVRINETSDSMPLEIVTDPDTLFIQARPQNTAFIDSLVTVAKTWNTNHGHGERVATAKREEAAALSDARPGWWTRNISHPLGNWLKRTFGPEHKEISTTTTGNIGVVYFHLSRPPDTDQEVVINLGRQSGDKSISLIEGSRMVFTDKNWDQPALAVIQLDPKLQHYASAEFAAHAGNIPLAWMITFLVLAGLFVLFFVYHKFSLPFPHQDVKHEEHSLGGFFAGFLNVFINYFQKNRIGLALAFILIYRFGEAQLVKIAPLFMLDVQEVGGLALTTGQYGFVYGTLGMIMLTLGGILGGIVAAKQGLKYWIWWMALAMKLPDMVYVYLASAQPDSFFLVNLCVAVEQFGYGFGFTAYMLFMIMISDGEHKTAHYAICTGFMALGMMIPGMFSGWLQEMIGYQNFFTWVLLCTIPGLLLIKFLPIDPKFGIKMDSN